MEFRLKEAYEVSRLFGPIASKKLGMMVVNSHIDSIAHVRPKVGTLSLGCAKQTV